MDKLKEVLKYQFWILLGVALILPFVGWIMGTSGMMTEAADRTKKLNDLNTSLVAKADDPNDEWSQGLSLINVEQEKQHDIAWRHLYESQKPKMVWPSIMKEDVDWPADDDPEKMVTRHMELYRQAYPGRRGEMGEFEKVRQIVKPIVDDDPQTGLVNYDPSLMPRPDEDWGSQAPSPKQIKAAQEDLWLLTAILECIAKVNEGAPNAYDAPIRQIDELLLRGGTKGAGASASKSAGSLAAGPTMSGTGTMGDMMKGMPSMMGGPGGMGGRQSGGTNMERYRDEQKEFKTRGFSLQIVMDHRRIPDLLVALSNCESWPINVLRVHEADYKEEDLVSGEGDVPSGGRSPMPSGLGGRRGGAGLGSAPGISDMSRGVGGRSGISGPRPSFGARGGAGDEGGEGFVPARSALDDPNLANVAIVGLIYIFNKPPDAPPAPPTAQPAETTQPVAGATPATEPADAADKTEPAGATDETTSETSSEKSDEKPDDSADTKPENAPGEGAGPGKSD